ncbi:NAD(P)/FAD-dependent oxidoreductase [Atopomonas sediminilitoris]|uniref:NAD(P)/FAD-dependent oxidoreductase n=1 Tax=Atopomonas sediminilitoris TaxID=2919919 RepID=UPI001F4EA38B|nr:FAD-binding oxidoreductase [Atopomonas sediminilitoris]MCJ8169410.1 FAD-binding oxidoreductase [Atopomonas sediminilitoris]
MLSSHAHSYYQASAQARPTYAPLQGWQRCDVCVIGGGYTGISAALALAERGYQVIVLEAEQLGWGASGRNGGQINVGLACEQSTLRGKVGAQDADKLWQLSVEGVALLRQRVAQFNIDCDLTDGCLLAAATTRQVRDLHAWQRDLEQHYHYPHLRYLDGDALQAAVGSPLYQGAVLDQYSGHLHPLNYLLGLATAARTAGVRFFEHSRAQQLRPQRQHVDVHVNGGHVQAQQVILAGNAYIGDLIPWQQQRSMPVGSFIGATAPLPAELAAQLIASRAAVCSMQFVIDYYRLSADNRLLFGGRASITGREPRDLRATLRRRMHTVFPQLTGYDFEFLWGGLLAMTANRAPQFGRLGTQVYYAQGYSGQGVALSGLAGLLMAEAIACDSQRFDLFSRLPHSPVPPGSHLQTAARLGAVAWYQLRDALGL